MSNLKLDREVIEINEIDIAPILSEYGKESWEYEYYSEYFDKDGNQIKDHISDDFEIVQQETIDSDLEKGYEDVVVVVRRRSDGKYFEGSYTHSPYRGTEYDANLIEVFPETKTITIYT